MLLMLAFTVVLSAVAIVAAAKIAAWAALRLGLDSTTILLWLGLAEWPSESRAPRTQDVVDRPARRRPRSPHRKLRRPSGRRRPAVSPPAG